ncbi:MAG TPA: glycosyltransferase family 4 protein [Phenylobacterium sp.]|jgi:glycosyltransferase involved in cell wall biosynthesis
MLEALEEHFDINLVVRDPFPAWFVFVRRVVRRLTAGLIDIMWSPFLTTLIGRPTLDTIKAADCDFVFAVAVTPLCANLVSFGPTVFVSDATQALLSNYNPFQKRLAPWVKRSARELETRAINGAAVCLFPSPWAASSAIADHEGIADRVVTVPWGANLIAEHFTPPEARSSTEWRLLFVGVDWHWKGGDIALAAVEEMRKRNPGVHIDVVGSVPSAPPPQIDGVTFHGFLNKNKPMESERLASLFRGADLLFLPTLSDALGIVFAEAASYAIPAVSYATGGVPAMVIHQETGLLLDAGADAHAFATAMTELLEDRDRYIKMSRAALERSRKVLNWPAWGRRVAGELTARRTDHSSVASGGA